MPESLLGERRRRSACAALQGCVQEASLPLTLAAKLRQNVCAASRGQQRAKVGGDAPAPAQTGHAFREECDSVSPLSFN